MPDVTANNHLGSSHGETMPMSFVVNYMLFMVVVILIPLQLIANEVAY